MNNSELLIYQTSDGRIKVDVRLEEETGWLTQAGMAELFQVKPQNITIHLKNIYAEGELAETATCKDFLHVQAKGASWQARNSVQTGESPPCSRITAKPQDWGNSP